MIFWSPIRAESADDGRIPDLGRTEKKFWQIEALKHEKDNFI